ncbi:MAG: uroporphyrinogen-III C-methyltransferase [Deltaproteobacteria bacterium]|nr:uroporphyrinogen-III C-methyltransferase [Deltaproteobacteria bacterium]
MTTGRVYLVGAGPGDPELLTVKAAALLQRADAIVYDRLIHPGVLAHARRGARLFYVGKEGFGAATAQSDINRLLIKQARLGRLVVRLKGGDPFVFGRGGEEALALAEADVPCEVVPGVTSGVAVPDLCGIPVTHRGVAASVTFAAAHRADGAVDWRHLAGADTLVLFMGGAKIAEIAAALLAQGKACSTPVAIIESGSFDDERIVESTLATVGAVADGARFSGPALVVIGEVVTLRHRLRLAGGLMEHTATAARGRR